MFPLASVGVVGSGRYGAGACLAMSSKNCVKEGLKRVPFAHENVARVKVPVIRARLRGVCG
jgi:hypothetical protein